MNYLILARRDNRFDVRFPLKRLSSKYKQHELCPHRTLWIRKKIARTRIAPITIASEASAIQFDERKSFACSDSLKLIAMTSPELIERCPYVSVKMSSFWQYICGYN